MMSSIYNTNQPSKKFQIPVTFPAPSAYVFSHFGGKRGNVNLRCLWQRAVLPIIVATSKRKEAVPDAQRKY